MGVPEAIPTPNAKPAAAPEFNRGIATRALPVPAAPGALGVKSGAAEAKAAAGASERGAGGGLKAGGAALKAKITPEQRVHNALRVVLRVSGMALFRTG